MRSPSNIQQRPVALKFLSPELISDAAARTARGPRARHAPEFYEHLRPMSSKDALAKEKSFAEELRANGYVVYGGHWQACSRGAYHAAG